MGTRKKIEFILMWMLAMTILLGGCMQQYAPINYGDLYNLYPGFTDWLSTQGDAMVKWFSNGELGMEVYARPFQDGWAVAVRKGSEAYGYFMNCQTWQDFRAWLVSSGGFAEMLRQIPNVVNMPMFAVPVMMPADGKASHIWEVMPWMCLPGQPCGGMD